MLNRTEYHAMRTILLILGLVVTATSSSSADQTKSIEVEKEIRRLEQEIVSALLRKDLAGVRKHQASDHVVNNPFGNVVDAKSGPIQQGQLTYSGFVREPERIIVKGNTVIVMGNETVTPSGTSPDAGKTLRRRFTNVWMHTEGHWVIVARHANVICDH